MRTSFLFPPFTGGNKEAQSSKWLRKLGCGCSVQETTSVPGSPGCTPGWDGSHCTGSQPSLHSLTQTLHGGELEGKSQEF